MPKHRTVWSYGSQLGSNISTLDTIQKIPKNSQVPAPVWFLLSSNLTCLGDADISSKGCKCRGLPPVSSGEKGKERKVKEGEWKRKGRGRCIGWSFSACFPFLKWIVQYYKKGPQHFMQLHEVLIYIEITGMHSKVIVDWTLTVLRVWIGINFGSIPVHLV